MPLKAELWRRLGLLVSGERPGDLNQAVMELGARICKPRRPACESCPLAHPCRARAGAGATAYPQLARAASGIVITLAVGLFRRGERVLVQRGDRPLLAGLWNLPYRVLDGGGAFEPESWRQLGLRVANPRPLGREEHSITRYKIRQQVLGGNARLLVREGAPEYRWIAAGEQAGLGLPAFSVKLLARYAPDFRAATNHPGSCLDPG
jgi:A/G-specific adenine glycosylase